MKTKTKKLHYYLAPIYVLAYIVLINLIANLIILKF